MNRYIVFSIALVALAAGIGLGLGAAPALGQADPPSMVYELRYYYANEGKTEDLHKRFREHTMAIFDKHGMRNIGYWTPADAAEGQADLVYIVAHASREQADANWKAFSADPEWQAVYKASHVSGELVKKVDRLYLNPTDYSQLK
jgi:hypothetical protein